jgi:hypothetical protein
MKRFRIIRKRSVISPDEVYMKHLDTSLDSSFDSITATTTTTTTSGGGTGVGDGGYDHVDSYKNDGYGHGDERGDKSDGDNKDGGKGQSQDYSYDDDIKDNISAIKVEDTDIIKSVVVNKKTIDDNSINNNATTSTTIASTTFKSPPYISHTISINDENISSQLSSASSSASSSSSSSSSSIVIPPSSTGINISRDNRVIPTYNRPQFIFNSSGNSCKKRQRCIYHLCCNHLVIIIELS